MWTRCFAPKVEVIGGVLVEFFEKLTIKRHAVLATMSLFLFVMVANNLAVTEIPVLEFELKSKELSRKLLALTVLVYTFTWLNLYIFDKKRVFAFEVYSSYRNYFEFYELPVSVKPWSDMNSIEKKFYLTFRLKASWFFVFLVLNFVTGILGFMLAMRVLFPWFPWAGDFLLDWLNFNEEEFKYFS